MQARDIAPHEILLPVRAAFIIFTFIAALLINLLPWSGWWLVIKPDFVALVVLYWCIQQPRKVGFTSAWLLGLVMDVAEGSLFGQHALAYSVLAFGGVALHRRLQMFDLRQQTTQVFGIFALTYAVYALVHWQVNGYVVWLYFLGCLTSTLLWTPLSLMFQSMRHGQVHHERRRRERRP